MCIALNVLPEWMNTSNLAIGQSIEDESQCVFVFMCVPGENQHQRSSKQMNE